MANKAFEFMMFGTMYPVYISVGTHQEGSLSVKLISADNTEYGTPFCDVTKPFNGEMGEYEAAVKGYAENKGVIQFLERNGFGKVVGRTIVSEFVQLPVFQFDCVRFLTSTD